MEVKDLWNKKAGRLEIDVDFLREQKVEAIRKLNSKIIVINAEHDFLTNNIIYTAMSESFRTIDEGEILPIYHAEIKEIEIDEENIEYKIKFIEEG